MEAEAPPSSPVWREEAAARAHAQTSAHAALGPAEKSAFSKPSAAGALPSVPPHAPSAHHQDFGALLASEEARFLQAMYSATQQASPMKNSMSVGDLAGYAYAAPFPAYPGVAALAPLDAFGAAAAPAAFPHTNPAPNNPSEMGGMRRVHSTGDLGRSPDGPQPYSAEERWQRVLKYREKRSRRKFDQSVKYACRKTLAEGRQRIRGRFAKVNAEEDEQPHAAEEDEQPHAAPAPEPGFA